MLKGPCACGLFPLILTVAEEIVRLLSRCYPGGNRVTEKLSDLLKSHSEGWGQDLNPDSAAATRSDSLANGA